MAPLGIPNPPAKIGQMGSDPAVIGDLDPDGTRKLDRQFASQLIASVDRDEHQAGRDHAHQDVERPAPCASRRSRAQIILGHRPPPDHPTIACRASPAPQMAM
jgi:hypothetical protein